MPNYRPLLLRFLAMLAIVLVAGYLGQRAFDPTATGAQQGGPDNVNRLRAEMRPRLADEILDQVRGQGGRQRAYSDYKTITDDSEKISLKVPSEWNDIDIEPWMFQGQRVGWFIAASPDLDDFYSRRAQPGVYLAVSFPLAQWRDQNALLDTEQVEFERQCRRGNRFDYQDAFYVGRYDHYSRCGNGAPNVLVAAVAPQDRRFIALLRIVMTSPADLEAAQRILESIQVLGDPEVDEHHDH